jgi:hypothetical protein
MTNEEMQDLYERTIGQDVVDSFRATDRLRAHAVLAETVLKFGRELVAQAYEEAASVAENVGAHWAEESGEHVEIAARLRRMKNLLVEAVPS